jgi:hypothetical protein
VSDTALAYEGPPIAKRKAFARWRRIVCGILVVLVCILVPVSVLAVWLHDTVLDTDRYVSTVAPLAHDPAVQEAIATRVTNSLVASTDLKARLADALPARSPVSASAVADGIQRVVHDFALRLVRSDQFATLWKQANRRAHTQLVAVLQGRGRGNVETKNGQVLVHLGPVVTKVKSALEKAGINVFSDVDGERVNNQVVLLDSDQLSKAQSAVDAFDKLAVALPILTIVLFVGAVLLSGNRRRTLLRTALGVAFTVAVVLTLFNVARSGYLDALGPDVNHAAAANVYDQLLGFLRTALRSIFLLGLIAAIGAWLTGPGKYASRIRYSTVGLFRGRSRASGAQPSTAVAFVSLHRSPLRVCVTAIGLAILVGLSHPGPIAVLTVAIIVLVCLGIVEVLSRKASPRTDLSLADGLVESRQGGQLPES